MRDFLVSILHIVHDARVTIFVHMKPTNNAQVHAWSTAVRVMVSRKRSSAALGTSIVTSATLAGATSIMKILQCFYVGGHEHELPNCKHVTSSSKPRVQRSSHIALIEWLR